jgi:hypothetical protein
MLSGIKKGFKAVEDCCRMGEAPVYQLFSTVRLGGRSGQQSCASVLNSYATPYWFPFVWPGKGQCGVNPLFCLTMLFLGDRIRLGK